MCIEAGGVTIRASELVAVATTLPGGVPAVRLSISAGDRRPGMYVGTVAVAGGTRPGPAVREPRRPRVPMTDAPAATPLEQLIARLSVAAEEAVRAGNLDQARATAEDIQLVDPDNTRAASIVAEVNRRERTPGEERALMTILFSDLVDSTVLAGRLEPEAMRDIYRLYREAAQQAVDRFGGFVLQYLGDGIVATFGYPTAHEDDARRAVHAGLALISGLAGVSEAARQRYQTEPRARVGIHTGPVVVSGLAAQDARERGSIVGVAPNLAARLQSEAEPGTVVVSDVTQALVRNHFAVRSVGLRQLKGIDRGVEVFVVDGVRSVGGRLDATRSNKAGLHGRDEARQSLVGAWEEVGNDRSAVGSPSSPARRVSARAGWRPRSATWPPRRATRSSPAPASSTTRTSRCGRCPP